MTTVTRQALSWNPQGKPKVGRPRQTCLRCIEDELKAPGIRWDDLRRICQKRTRSGLMFLKESNKSRRAVARSGGSECERTEKCR
ncbi:hypothetical protein RRG08_033794 [Elysia crispata]|uniref:Uncharacterized protein n=1 Tax=Elysia crispata TaxID=231223 RepID=A0AAE1B8W9_9GAST|nr:hypothetical protein RRG08_033794 [Elysia crispata]